MTGAPTHLAQRGALVVELARARGFAAAGVAPLEPTDHAGALRDWLDAGRHGDMAYLAEQIEERLDPQRVLPGARSVLMVADLYAARQDWSRDAAAPAAGRIARYARGRDYHEVVRRRLRDLADALRERFPGAQFRSFADTAPVLEREHAVRCGLGWQAKHTLLIHPRLGSWSVLGGFYTTLDLAPPPDQRVHPDACGTCTRCIDACPTDAITPYSVDATRCISYLTIERRGPIDPALWRGVGDWLVGCDICQEVCPHNSPRPGQAAANPAYAPRRAGFDLLEVLGWDEPTRRARFSTSAMKRITLAMIRRNAIVCACNALLERDDPALRARIEDLAWDAREEELVRVTAREALARLGEAGTGPPAG